jgi:hypothetical protein
LVCLHLALTDQCWGQLQESALVLVHRQQELLTIFWGLRLRDGRLAGREGLAKRCRQVVLVFFHLVSLSKPNMSA